VIEWTADLSQAATRPLPQGWRRSARRSSGQPWVLFSYTSFPGVRFGYRFPLGLDEYGGDPVYLREEIETGALDRMMRAQPAADDDGIIWTTWGDPGPD